MVSKKHTLRNKGKMLRNKKRTMRNKKHYRKTNGGKTKKGIFKVRVAITQGSDGKSVDTHIFTRNLKDSFADVLLAVNKSIKNLSTKGIEELQDPKLAMSKKTGSKRIVKEFAVDAEEPVKPEQEGANKEIFKVRVAITQGSDGKSIDTHITTMNLKDSFADALLDVRKSFQNLMTKGIEELKDPKRAMDKKTGTKRIIKEFTVDAEEPAKK